MGVETKYSKGNPAKVLIVDDQALYREGLREIMGHWHEFEVVGEAADGWSALSFCRKRRPNLVIMDNMMPMMSGIEAAKRILAECSRVAIVMLTVAADEEDLLNAFDCGVRGFILKETPSRQLRIHLQEVVNGDAVVSASIMRGMVSNISSKRIGLSRTEQDSPSIQMDSEDCEIMKLVAQGLSNEAIGAELYISSGLVKKRLRTIMEKLGLVNRVQVAVYAVRHGIV